MVKSLTVSVTPEVAANDKLLVEYVSHKIQISACRIALRIEKRSIDARQKQIKINLRVAIHIDEPVLKQVFEQPSLKVTHPEKKIFIIGAGPAGLFAALRVLELGCKPIIIEQGKDVQSRRRDLAKITKEHIVDETSNYCFGEGGAGTYSDGKLYTRSKKRGDVRRILELLVAYGAHENVLVEAHPHIGTNKLPSIIVNIREAIITAGGEVRFESRFEDVLLEGSRIQGIVVDGKRIPTSNLILATGHSARDVFHLLHRKNIKIEAKEFALGVRVEHSQQLIDRLQYKTNSRGEFLPPASYSLVTQIEDRAVFSFCMCPGGVIAPCATGEDHVVTNGWSPSKRNGQYANSGIVVEIKEKDWAHLSVDHGPLAALEFQRQIEKVCWEAAGRSQRIPAQRMLDFVQNKHSDNLPESSYHPGKVSVELRDIFPEFISDSLAKALVVFGEKMKGYLTNEAVLHATESRTSSPVRIPRDRETLQHADVTGLYPCAEGAGYAGGIISAAIDGQKCAEKCCETMLGA